MKKVLFNALAAALLLASGAPSAVATDDHNPIGVAGLFEGMITTGGAYNVLNHNARREIDDIVVPGAIGKYGLKMTRYYNSRSTMVFDVMGAGWTHGYQWTWNLSHNVVDYPTGDKLDTFCDPPLGVSDGWETGNPTCNPNCQGDFRLADGGKVHFDTDVYRHTHAAAIIDPYGYTTTLTYDNSGLLKQVTEPGNRYLLFTYHQVDGQQVLWKVQAYDGQGSMIDSVVYNYASKPTGGIDVPTAVCLTSVDYSDGQHAKYTYTTDNQPEHPGPLCPCSIKVLPLVRGCNDVRYGGPMRRISYDYPDQSAHGAIIRERYWDGVPGDEGNGAMVSKIDPPAPSPLDSNPNFETTYTETRGDGNGNITRKFIYTDLHLHRIDGNPCPDITLGPARSQFLLRYTDFKNHATQLGYDDNWYVNSVTDANGHTTLYDRGPPPNAYPGPKGIGQIKTITHPDGYYIQYGYYNEGSNIGGHYLTSITDERGNKTIHTRDPVTHQITKTEHQDAGGHTIAYEEFQYSNNNFGLLSTHHLPSNTGWSGPYVHFQYDNRGLLIAKTNPTANGDWASAIATAPQTTYSYYAANDPIGGNAWVDRVKTVTLSANAQGFQASDTYEYDKNGNTAVPGRGLVTKIAHNDANHTYQSFDYDIYGNKLWEENELRRRTSYTYDNYNRVLTVKDPIGQGTGRTTIYTYNPTIGTGSPFTQTTNSPDSVTTPAGIHTSNVYDENFRKTSSTIGTSTTKFDYDNVGNPTTVTDPLQHATSTDYDARNRKWHVTNALYQTTTFGYDPAGNVTSITRPDNRVESKVYDVMNRLTLHTVPKGGGEGPLTTTFQYWPSGKLLWVQDPKQQGTQLATYFEYNESDEMIRMWYPGLAEKREWSYDDAHNLKSRTTVGGKTQSFTYDIRNRKVGMTWDNFADWASFTYYDDGKLKTAQNANSTVTRMYDNAGRLTLDQQNVTGLGDIKNVNYPTYDDDGKLTQMNVTNQNGSVAGYDYTIGYDLTYGRFEKITPTGGSVALQYYYDAASNEIHRDNFSNGVTQVYNRDNLNRIWRLEVKKGASPLGYEDYGYDAMNRLVSTTREDNKQDQYGYWWDGELLGVAYGADPTPTPSPPPPPTPTPPGGQVAEPSFAPAGRNIYPNSSVTVSISTTSGGAQIRYTLDGSVPTSNPPNGTVIANGASVTFSPGIAGKTLNAIGFKSGMTDSNVHSDYYYRENPGGGPVADGSPRRKNEPPAQNRGLAQTMSDILSGSMSPDNIDISDVASRAVVYYYDGAGNRTSVVDSGSGTTAYTPNNLNQYDTVEGSTIVNGPEHEVKSYQAPNDSQVLGYGYINDERLSSVNAGHGVNYQPAYDALGRCVKRTISGPQANVVTWYIYDGEKPILEYSASDLTHPAKNLYGKGIDEILMRTDPTVNGGVAFYYQQNHEGSVTHLTKANGTVIEKYRYDVFGAPTFYNGSGTQISGSAYNNRFLFTGREYAAAFGFYEYRARAYHPSLGRFMSEDPKLFDPGDYNLFRYCHNDPLDVTDPMGTDPPVAYSPREESLKRVDITIAERISLWQKSMESSIGGEQAFHTEMSLQISPSYHGEGSLSNLQKRADMGSIAAARIGSHEYDRAASKDEFASGTYKCNKFDYDVERTAQVTPMMVWDNDIEKMRAASAGERATLAFQDWRRLGRNEGRLPGDEAAFAKHTINASGHTGVVVSDGRGGTTIISAHAVGVSPNSMQFDAVPSTVYLRYTGE